MIACSCHPRYLFNQNDFNSSLIYLDPNNNTYLIVKWLISGILLISFDKRIFTKRSKVVAISSWIQWLVLVEIVEHFFAIHHLDCPPALKQEYRGDVFPVLRTNVGFVIIFNENMLPVALVGQRSMHTIYPFDFQDEGIKKIWDEKLKYYIDYLFSLLFLKQQSITLSSAHIPHRYYVYAVTRLNDEDVVPTTELVTLPV